MEIFGNNANKNPAKGKLVNGISIFGNSINKSHAKKGCWRYFKKLEIAPIGTTPRGASMTAFPKGKSRQACYRQRSLSLDVISLKGNRAKKTPSKERQRRWWKSAGKYPKVWGVLFATLSSPQKKVKNCFFSYNNKYMFVKHWRPKMHIEYYAQTLFYNFLQTINGYRENDVD